MSLLDTLVGIFSDEEAPGSLPGRPRGLPGRTARRRHQPGHRRPRCRGSSRPPQGNTGGATQGWGGHVRQQRQRAVLPPAARGGVAAEDRAACRAAIEAINHYTSVVNVNAQTFEDNDSPRSTTGTPRSTTRVNQNIEAFGDVNQDFDNDVVSRRRGRGGRRRLAGQHRRRGRAGRRRHHRLDHRHRRRGRLGDRRRLRLDRRRRQPGHRRLHRRGGQLRRGRRHQRRRRERHPGRRHARRRHLRRRHLQPGRRRPHPDRGLDLSESVVGDGRSSPTTSPSRPSEGSSVAFGDGSDAVGRGPARVEGNYGTVQVADDGDPVGHDRQLDQRQLQHRADSFNSAFDATDASTNDSYNTSDSGNYAVDATDASSTSEVTDASDDDYTYTDSSTSDDDYEDIDAGFDGGPPTSIPHGVLTISQPEPHRQGAPATGRGSGARPAPSPPSGAVGDHPRHRPGFPARTGDEGVPRCRLVRGVVP